MSNFLPLAGMIIAGLIGIVCLADVAVGFPFQRVSVLLDCGFLLTSVIVAYLNWCLLEKARR